MKLLLSLVPVIAVFTAHCYGFPESNIEELEEEMVLGDLKSASERGTCVPLISCTLAGGHCIKCGQPCNGTIDPKGCKKRRCECCIPEIIPVTCPVVASTPCPTIPTEATTTVIDTTAPSTTRPDISCPDTKVDAGEDLVCSRRTASYTWQQAVDYCTSLGLNLAQPKHLFDVASKIVDQIGQGWYWIGGKGTGSHQQLLNGTLLDPSLPMWESGHPLTSTSDCLALYCTPSEVSAGTILRTFNCTKSNGHALCE